MKRQADSDREVLIYIASIGGIETGRRFLSYEEAERYMREHDLYYVCDRGDGRNMKEYYLHAQDIETALDYNDKLWSVWPEGWEPNIEAVAVRKVNYAEVRIGDVDYFMFLFIDRVQLNRKEDGLYIGSFPAESKDDMTRMNAEFLLMKKRMYMPKVE